MLKRIVFAFSLSLCLVASGCLLTELMSDKMEQVYTFRGTVLDSLTHRVIAGVVVTASCRRTKLSPPLETVSGSDGFFRLGGVAAYGPLDDCGLRFTRPGFKSKVVVLNRFTPGFTSEGWHRAWNLHVELQPKN